MKLLSRVPFFVTPWTVAYQAPPSIEFSSQEYWSGLPVDEWFLITHFLPHYKSLLSLKLEELKLMVFQSPEMGLLTLKLKKEMATHSSILV